jgi:hypothetical protein
VRAGADSVRGAPALKLTLAASCVFCACFHALSADAKLHNAQSFSDGRHLRGL